FRQSGRSFLRPAEGVEILPETTIDISHESLMRVWGRLVSWVQLEAEDARTYLRLCEDARAFHAESISVLQDPMLQVALNWRESARPTEAWAQRYDPAMALMDSFLDASRDERDSELQLRDRKREAAFLRWKRAALLGLALVLTLILLGAWAVNSNQIAVNARKEAERAEQEAKEERGKADAAKLEAGKAEQAAAEAEREARKKQAAAKKAEEKAEEFEEQAAKSKKDADVLRDQAEELGRKQEQTRAQIRQTERVLADTRAQQQQLSAKMDEAEKQLECKEYIEKVVIHRTALTRMMREALTVARSAPLVARQDRQLGAALVLEAHRQAMEIHGEDDTPSTAAPAGCEVPNEDWQALTNEDETALELALSDVWREFDTSSGARYDGTGVPIRALAIDNRSRSTELFYGLANGEIVATPAGSGAASTTYKSGCDSVRSLLVLSVEAKRLLVAGCFDGRITVLPTAGESKRRAEKEITGLDAKASITSLIRGPEQSQLLYATAAGEVGSIALSSTGKGEAKAELPGVKLVGKQQGAAFLATSADRRTLVLSWRAQGRSQIASYRYESGSWALHWQESLSDEISALAVDPAGTRVAIGLAGGDVIIWEFAAAAGERRKTTARALVRGVAFDSLGHVAAADADGRAYVWTYCEWDKSAAACKLSLFGDAGRLPLEFEHDGDVWALGFAESRQSRGLYSVDEKGKGYVWSTDVEAIYGSLCAKIETPLAEPDWRSRFRVNADHLDEAGVAWQAHCPKGAK
ncbi:MAG: hypothetical protein KC431_17540, partial [Myxococcales bacterium]|nr:hypothetical protein [Myxococcales bacterium]